MAEPFLPEAVDPPDFYVAAIGRSGSTMLCNWLSAPPDRLVFIEPFFLRPENSRLLRIQLADFGLGVTDDEWCKRDEIPAERFERLMGKRLQGRRWALKEVLCEEHFRVLDALAPPKVLITVRNIEDVALSFFEKHREQRNLARFSDEWVAEYCVRESAGIIRFHDLLESQGRSFQVVRYEDFVPSIAERERVARFVSWPGHGDTTAHLASFDRSFELRRQGSNISGVIRRRSDRDLGSQVLGLSDRIAQQCADYQRRFGYY